MRCGHRVSGYKHFATDGNHEHYVRTGNGDGGEGEDRNVSLRPRLGGRPRRGETGLASQQKEKWGIG